MGPRFYLLIVPLSALGAIGTAIGLRARSSEAGAASIAVALAVGLGCFFAARTFRGRAAWMAVFIFGLSVAAGVVLAGLAWEGTREAAIATAAVLLMAAAAGRAKARWFAALYGPLWFAAWFFAIGLIASWLDPGPGTWTVPLAMITALVFSGLAAAWFARLPPAPQPVLAMDLYLLGLNLFLTIGILKRELAWP